MELEYKWDLPNDMLFQELLIHPQMQERIRKQTQISMQSIYYDTPEQMFFHLRGALRLRKENDEYICCMKMLTKANGACTTREEYEVPAQDIMHGLRRLPSVGAPAIICAEALKHGVDELCCIQFVRNRIDMIITSKEGFCSAELSFDEGFALNKMRSVPIRELEYEYKDGNESVFHSTATWMEEIFCLKQQPLSKLARALRQ